MRNIACHFVQCLLLQHAASTCNTGGNTPNNTLQLVKQQCYEASISKRAFTCNFVPRPFLLFLPCRRGQGREWREGLGTRLDHVTISTCRTRRARARLPRGLINGSFMFASYRLTQITQRPKYKRKHKKKEKIPFISLALVVALLRLHLNGVLTKPRRRLQQGHQTKGLMSSTTA